MVVVIYQSFPSVSVKQPSIRSWYEFNLLRDAAEDITRIVS